MRINTVRTHKGQKVALYELWDNHYSYTIDDTHGKLWRDRTQTASWDSQEQALAVAKREIDSSTHLPS